MFDDLLSTIHPSLVDGTSGDGSLVKCLPPSKLAKELDASESVLHIKGGIRGLFCGYNDQREAAALDGALSTLFKQDWQGLHSSTSQLNLSRFGHLLMMYHPT